MPSSLRFILLCLLCFASSATATGLFRAYLSIDGLDTNPCTVQQPCRLLPAALTAVADGGEVWMVDSANYGNSITISKNVTILAVPGALGSVTARDGNPAIKITADNLSVTLRNLLIGPVVGAVDGTHGVHMTGASNLTIESSEIANMPLYGVLVVGAGTLRMTNSTLRGNHHVAVVVLNGAVGMLSGVQMLGNDLGGVVAQTTELATNKVTKATVSDSVISGGVEGVYASASGSGSVARVHVIRTTIEQTDYALDSGSGAGGVSEVSVGNSLIVNCFRAWNVSGPGSSVISFGNNQFRDNTQQLGSLTSAPLM